MRTTAVSFVAAACLCAPAALLPAQAGLAVTFESQGAGGKAPKTTLMRLEADRMSMELPGEEGRTMIFRGDKQAFWVVDPGDKTWSELTKQQVQAMTEQFAAVRPELEEQMKSLPPEQQEMIREALKGLGDGGAAGAAASPRSYVKSSQAATINGWPCVRYDQMHEGRKEAELWMTDWKNLGITSADFKVVDDMAAFAKDLAGPILDQVGAGFLRERSGGQNFPPGFAVRTVRKGPSGDSIEELKKVTRQQNPASLFEIPAGYAQKELAPAGGF